MGAVCANDYAEKIKACIEKDRLLTERFHQLLDGKWDGMALSEHIGFVNWNDEECRYPLMTFIEPANKRGSLPCQRAVMSVRQAGTGRKN